MKAGLTCPPDSAPAPAEVLARVRRRGEEEEKERRVSGADRQQTWQQHFLRWAILYSLSLTYTFKVQRGEIRDAVQKKKRDFLGIFPKGGGRVFSNPKTFVNLPSVFLDAKIILRCQNMFYNSGEVISDQFHHITLDSKSGKF